VNREHRVVTGDAEIAHRLGPDLAVPVAQLVPQVGVGAPRRSSVITASRRSRDGIEIALEPADPRRDRGRLSPPARRYCTTQALSAGSLPTAPAGPSCYLPLGVT
jgi:hypothetical protein